jgi:ribonuclease D
VPGAIVRRQGRRASRPLRPRQRLFAPNLKALLGDPDRLKLYHFARFDVGIMQRLSRDHGRAALLHRTASRLVRTYTDRHGLKDLVKELLNIDLSKQQQTSDWGAPELSDAQREYAASDVRYLHALKEKLDERLERENRRMALAQACFDFLPARACSISPAGRAGHFRPWLSRRHV